MEKVKTPWHLWLVGFVALLWNIVGVAAYMLTELHMLADLNPATPAEELDYYYGFPAWAVAVWALGVWGALIGTILLLLRHRWAVAVYAISIIGLLGTTYYQRVASQLPATRDTTGEAIFALMIWAIALFLLFYASRMRRAGVLR